MELIYRLLANIVVIVHFAYVLLVILGLILVLVGWWRKWDWVLGFWFRSIHLNMILIVVGESWMGIVCPLTVWENDLRKLAGQTGYRGDFLATLVHDILFYEAPPWVFTLAYTCFGLMVILGMILAPPRWPKRRT